MNIKLALPITLGMVSMLVSAQAGTLPLGSYASDPPISFTYGGKSSAELLKTWKVKRASKQMSKGRTQQTITYVDPATKLEVKTVSVAYGDSPTVEWTAYFRNAGKADTPILSDIKAINTRFELGETPDLVIHHNKGTFVTPEDYEPLITTLKAGAKAEFTPPDGRPTRHVWPYYNLQYGDGGAIVVVGWPGRWTASFKRDRATGLSVTAGQYLTHMKLKPGEKIRTPLIVVQEYKGTWIDAQNAWRRWMVAYNVPRVKGGKLPPQQMTPCSSHQFAEMINANEENQKFFIDRYVEEGLKPDYWWMDAGWYICDGSWWKTGTWEVDPKRFPNGLRAISDHARKKGVKTLVWFEPERVQPGTWLHENRKQWLLLPKSAQGLINVGDPKPEEQGLLNLGNPEALKWAINHFDGLLKSQGIDLYRQDYNVDPWPYWVAGDTEDRQGYTENAYVQGYLAYWDGLRKRNPGMLIDSCSGGGHRNDLETMRRSVPLLRSDYIFEPIGQQGHSYGLAQWIPFFGTGVMATDAYGVRSCMCSGAIPCWDMRNKDLDYASLRKLVPQWREYSKNYYGDYYPLTEYNRDKAKWIAWQYNSPKEGKGIVQAFRREENPDASITLKLMGLKPKTRYSVSDIDTGETAVYTGQELMDKGLVVKSDARPAAKVIQYQKAR